MPKSFLLIAMAFLLISWPEIATAEETDPGDENSLSDEEAMEIVKQHRGRAELKELLELWETNQIDKEEYERRMQEIRAKYLGDEIMPIPTVVDVCSDIDCSSVGTCEVIEGEPKCTCPIETGYVPDPETGLSCVPSRPSTGWARTAAIAGLVATPVAALLTASAFGTHAMEKNGASLGLQIAGLSVFSIMGPTLAAGSASARKSATVSGAPIMRMAGHITYAAGLVVGGVTMPLYASSDDPKGWHMLAWGGAGSLSLLFHSIDAATSYNQAANALYGEQELTTRRPWTWTAFIVGAAAAAGAVTVGVKARNKRNALYDLPPSETLCQDMVVGDQSASCNIREDELEAKKWAGGADILIGAAATGLAMGTVLYFVEPMLPCPKILQDVSFTPFASPTSAGLMIGGRF